MIILLAALAKLLGKAGKVTADTTNSACIIFFVFDEPEMPKHMIER